MKIGIVGIQLLILGLSLTLIIMIVTVTEKGPDYPKIYDNLYFL
jgi:hypothetical protein